MTSASWRPRFSPSAREGRPATSKPPEPIGKAGEVTVSTWASPIRDSRGSIVGISFIARDVTHRRLLEERLQIAVESSPSALVMVSAKGEILMVNEETERLFGYVRDELLGSSIEMLVPERFRGAHPLQRSDFMAHSETRAMGKGRDILGLRKDGTEFPVEIGLRSIHTAEGIVVLSAIIDISGRKRTEDALERQSRELARSNAELEQFANVASHDLQEPLRTVTSYTRLLEQRYSDRLDDDAKLYLRFAQDGAVRMQSLIEGLLAYSHIRTREYELVPVVVADALLQALANLRATVEESGAEVVHRGLPTVRADPTQMAELFQNLVANAIKFRGAELPRIEIAATRDETRWVISVKDNGIGIDPRYFERIFQVLQRLHSREEYPGTGIGLAICRRIVERHGGRIWVESELGRGSTFFFSIPCEGPRDLPPE